MKKENIDIEIIKTIINLLLEKCHSSKDLSIKNWKRENKNGKTEFIKQKFYQFWHFQGFTHKNKMDCLFCTNRYVWNFFLDFQGVALYIKQKLEGIKCFTLKNL